MLTAYVALAPEYPGFDLSQLMRVAAAIQKQIVRDVAPIWGVSATVDPFASLEDIPIGYWPVVVTTRDLGGQDGTHLDEEGSPYALVEAEPHWSLTASHECIEMILDPFGSRTVAGTSPRDDQGRAEFLVEVCDPCQGSENAYTVNEVLLADFVTPAYFEIAGTPGGRGLLASDLVASPRARYSYSGRVARPRDVLRGGYLSWRDPITRHWWQRSCPGGRAPVDLDLGPLDLATRGHRSLREVVNSFTQHNDRLARSVPAEMLGNLNHRIESGRRASQRRAMVLRTHARSLPPLAKAPAGPSPLFQTPQTRRAALTFADEGAEIDRAIALLTAKPELPDCARILATVQKAKAQWTAASRAPAPRRDFVAMYPEGGELALVRTAIQTPLVAPHATLLMGRSIAGFSQYEALDMRWLATVWNHLFRPVVPFPVAPTVDATVHPLAPSATIALVGDWGTGNAAARRVADKIAGLKPTYTIHLGDVYYSGTEGEETDNLLASWPPGSAGSFVLNGNHDMYSGGQGYFNVALANEKFAKQGPYSYFALANDDWVILGLDSAYVATHFYLDGSLNAPQLSWLAELVAAGTLKRKDGTRKRVIVLTHHQGLDPDGTKRSPGLWDQVTSALGGGPDYWYWGHLHGVAVFKPVSASGVTVNARLVGHGAVPYLSDPITPAMAWTESSADVDLIRDDGPTRSRNGYAFLQLDGRELKEVLYDELGGRRWASDAPTASGPAGAAGPPR